MTGYMGFVDPALPKVIGCVESTTFLMSHDTFSEADEARDLKFYYVLLASVEADAMDELWRRTSQRYSQKLLGTAQPNSRCTCMFISTLPA